ncbi:MAG TPA: hypothetical protein VGA67_05980 [Candidatus Dojkabacteria bacterium]|jgi:hypothetical protein
MTEQTGIETGMQINRLRITTVINNLVELIKSGEDPETARSVVLTTELVVVAGQRISGIDTPHSPDSAA